MQPIDVRDEAKRGIAGRAYARLFVGQGELCEAGYYSSFLGFFHLVTQPTPEKDQFPAGVLFGMLVVAIAMPTAENEAIATNAVFDRDVIVRIIENLEKFPDYWTDKHDLAGRLRAFYLGGPGDRHLRQD